MDSLEKALEDVKRQEGLHTANAMQTLTLAQQMDKVQESMDEEILLVYFGNKFYLLNIEVSLSFLSFFLFKK